MKTLTRLLIIAAGCAIIAGPVRAGETGKGPGLTANVKSTAKSAGIEWLKYDDGIARAKKEGKPIIIDFYTNWCGYCKKMDRSTFKDPKIIEYFRDNFIAIRVNGEAKDIVSHKGERISERELTKAFGVRGYPTFWFLDSNGERIGPAPGYKTTVAFMPLLQYVSGSHYKTMKYEAFLKQKKDNS